MVGGVQAIGRASGPLAGVANIGINAADCNASQSFFPACTVVRSYLKIRDVRLLAPFQSALLDSLPATSSMQDDPNMLPKLVAALQCNIVDKARSLADLNFANFGNSIENHWQFNSIGVASLQAQSISTFSGDIERRWLRMCSDCKVEAATVHMKSAIPSSSSSSSWSAGFQDDRDNFENFEMATQLFHKQATSIVSAHISARALLGIIGEGGADGVSPQWQKHELTSQSACIFTLCALGRGEAAVVSARDVLNEVQLRGRRASSLQVPQEYGA